MKHNHIFAALMLFGASSAHAQGLPGGAFDLNASMAEAVSNPDGSITKAQFLETRARLFDELDRNHDGNISLSEFMTAAKGRFNVMEATAAFLAFDSDHDGRISRMEWRNGPTPGFDRADRNHDGVLSADEVSAARRSLARR